MSDQEVSDAEDDGKEDEDMDAEKPARGMDPLSSS